MTDLILLATLALIVWATFYFGDIYDAQVALKHKASRDAITPELVDALIDQDLHARLARSLTPHSSPH